MSRRDRSEPTNKRRPGRPRAGEQVPGGSRSRLLDAAAKVFAERGYRAASVDEVAAEAGFSKGAVYWHFASKEELLVAIFEQSMRDIQESFAAGTQGADSKERFERYVRGCFDVLRRNLDFWRLSYGVRMQVSVLADLGDRVPSWTAEIRKTLQRFLRDLGVHNPRLEADVLFALIDGVSQHYALDADEYPLDKVAERILEMYLPSRR